jgi:hypothetical protein
VVTKLATHYSRDIGYGNAGEDECLSFKLPKGGTVSELHITRVAVNMGGKIHIIDADGVRTIEGKATGVGVSVFTQYVDEGWRPTHYERHEQFHKGHVVERITLVEGPEIVEKRQDIWRD